MKTLKFIGLCIVLITIETSIYANEFKIGVVNVTVILEQSAQKNQALFRLEKEFLSRNKDLEKKHDDLLVAQEEIARNGSILGANELKERERSILVDQRALKHLQDVYNEDFSIRRNEELRKLEINIADTIINLGKNEFYDLIIYQGYIYMSDRMDITAKVLQLLDTQINNEK